MPEFMDCKPPQVHALLQLPHGPDIRKKRILEFEPVVGTGFNDRPPVCDPVFLFTLPFHLFNRVYGIPAARLLLFRIQ